MGAIEPGKFRQEIEVSGNEEIFGNDSNPAVGIQRIPPGSLV
jgi:hypothetical protein